MSIMKTKSDAQAFAKAHARAEATKPRKKKGPRWPEQRDAFKLAGTTASMLKAWLGCEYLRARDLRSGHAMLRGEELATIMREAPATATVLASKMAPKDVRQRGLFDDDGTRAGVKR